VCYRCNKAWHRQIEGASCSFGESHFLCNLCFGEYIGEACQLGGQYEKDIKTSDENVRHFRPLVASAGVTISGAGKLPCVAFPADCGCGNVPNGTIMKVLLDQRNRSSAGVSQSRLLSLVESSPLSPHQAHEAARNRVYVKKAREESSAAELASAQTSCSSPLDLLRRQVMLVLAERLLVPSQRLPALAQRLTVGSSAAAGDRRADGGGLDSMPRLRQLHCQG